MPITAGERPITEDERRWARATLAKNQARRRARLPVHLLRGLAVALVLTPLAVPSGASVWMLLSGFLAGMIAEALAGLTRFQRPDDRIGRSIISWVESGVSRRLDVEVRRVFPVEGGELVVLDCGVDALICAEWWFCNLRDCSSQFMEDLGRETPEEFAPARFTVEFEPHPVPQDFLPEAEIIELERQRLPACPDRDLQREVEAQGILHLPSDRLPPPWRSVLDASRA